jgi:glyoxylate reductase
MSPAPILVTRPIPEAGLERLQRAGLAFVAHPHDRALDRPALKRLIRGRRGVLATLHDVMDAEVFESAGPDLRVVANLAVGHNNIDLAEATRRGIAVTNTPDVLTDATADLTWALILATARRLGEGERMVRAGRFEGWSPTLLLGADLHGRTLGIVGAGQIGSAVARRSRGWEMRVLYTSRSRSESLESVCDAQQVPLEALCRESDVISVHVPLTDETRHLFGADEFARMKADALFINTSRGPVHDEGALAAALREGVIGGAGLDVFENEPAIHPDLIRSDRAVILPHLQTLGPVPSNRRDHRRPFSPLFGENSEP